MINGYQWSLNDLKNMVIIFTDNVVYGNCITEYSKMLSQSDLHLELLLRSSGKVVF